MKVLFESLSGMFRDDDHIVPHVRRSLNGLKDNCICSRSFELLKSYFERKTVKFR